MPRLSIPKNITFNYSKIITTVKKNAAEGTKKILSNLRAVGNTITTPILAMAKPAGEKFLSQFRQCRSNTDTTNATGYDGNVFPKKNQDCSRWETIPVVPILGPSKTPRV